MKKARLVFVRVLYGAAILAATYLFVSPLEIAAQRRREVANVMPAEKADGLLGEWRKVERRDEILQRMGLRDGHIVADVGAGLGWI